MFLHPLHPSSRHLPVSPPYSHVNRAPTTIHDFPGFLLNMRQVSNLKEKATCADNLSIDKMFG